MKFGTMTFLTTLILTGVLTIPVRLAAQSSSSEDTIFDAPGAGTAAGSGFGTCQFGLMSPRLDQMIKSPRPA